MGRIQILPVSLVLHSLAIPVIAAPPSVVLDVGALPTDQPGWSFISSGPHASESVEDLFTPGVDFLRSNSMGFSPVLGSGGAVAQFSVVPFEIPADGTVVLDVRVQLLDEFLLNFSYGFSFGACVGGSCISVGLGLERLQFQGLSVIELSSAGFSTQDTIDYRLIGDFGSGQYEVWINGALLSVQDSSPFGGGSGYFYLGDGTGSANADALVYHYRAAVYGCSPADIAAPFGVVDLSDIGAFIDAFNSGGALADSRHPYGVVDLSDISAFVDAFLGGCP